MNKLSVKISVILVIFFIAITIFADKNNLIEKFKSLGEQSFKNGDYSQAKKYFWSYKDRVKDSNSKFYASKYLVEIYLKLQDITATKEELNFIIEHQQKDNKIIIKYFKAEILRLEEEYEKAINLYDEVIDTLKPDDELFFKAIHNLGNTYIKLQRWSSAILTFQKLYNNAIEPTHEILASKKIIFARIINKEFDKAKLLLNEIPKTATKMDLIEYKLLRILFSLKTGIEIEKSEISFQTIISNNKFIFLNLTYTIAIEFSQYFKNKKNIDKSIKYLVNAYNLTTIQKEKKQIINEFVAMTKYKKFIKTIKKYLTLYRNDFSMKLQLARLYYEIKDTTNALEIYQELAIEKKISKDLRITVAYESSAIYETMGDYENAEKQLLNAISGLSDINKQGDILYTISNLYYNQKKFDKAEQNLKEIDSKYNDMENVLKRIVDIQILMKKNSNAILTIEQYLKQFPKGKYCQDLLFHHALILYRIKKINEAQTELKSAIKEYPEHKYAPQALFVLGEISFSLDDYQIAIQNFSEIAQTYPKSKEAPNALYRNLLINCMLGENNNAMKAAKLLVQTYPKSLFAHNALFRMSDYFYNKNLPSSAIKALREVILNYKKKTMSQNDIDIIGKAMFEIAYIKEEKINADEALYEIEKFENEYIKSSSFADIMFLKGNILAERLEYQESILAYKSALQRKPDETFKIKCKEAIATSFYASSFQEKDEKSRTQYLKDAIQYRSEILSIETVSTQVKIKNLFKLGKIYEILQDFEKAKEYYKHSKDEYLLNLKTGMNVNIIWLSKSIYALINIYYKNENENIKEIVKCYNLLIQMELGNETNHNIQINKLNEKYSLK